MPDRADKQRLNSLVIQDTAALETKPQLVEAVYTELRRLADHLLRAERPGQTLQPTALVHEAYVRLLGVDDDHWNDSRHYLNACALAMRRILIERARNRRPDALPSGGSALEEILTSAAATFDLSADQVDALDQALTALADHNERWAEIAQLRFFLGLSIEQTARALGVSESTVKADWRFCSAWLRLRIGDDE